MCEALVAFDEIQEGQTIDCVAHPRTTGVCLLKTIISARGRGRKVGLEKVLATIKLKLRLFQWLLNEENCSMEVLPVG